MLKNSKILAKFVVIMLFLITSNINSYAFENACSEIYRDLHNFPYAEHQVASSLVLYFQQSVGASRTDACKLAKAASGIVTDRLEIFSEFHTDLAGLTKAVYNDVFRREEIKKIFFNLWNTGAVVSGPIGGVSKLNNILKVENQRGANYYKFQSTVATYLYYFRGFTGREIALKTKRYYLKYHFYWGEMGYVGNACGYMSCFKR